MTYPATFTLEPPEKVANWRPLVQWLLAVPHLIVLYVLSAVGSVVGVISWFAIVFTGSLPEGLANFSCLVLRYQARVTTYVGFLHSEYPPFDFTTSAADPGGTPVRADFVPALEGRNRLTVGLRLIWMIPAMIFAAIIYFIAQIVWLIAFFAVLFTGKWPAGMQSFVIGAMRVGLRTNAYAYLLTDEYPPFETA